VKRNSGCFWKPERMKWKHRKRKIYLDIWKLSIKWKYQFFIINFRVYYHVCHIYLSLQIFQMLSSNPVFNFSISWSDILSNTHQIKGFEIFGLSKIFHKIWFWGLSWISINQNTSKDVWLWI
jgi:hypothetical protein